MNKFLMMLIEDANITGPTFFVKVSNVRKTRKISLQTPNGQHVLDCILTKSWLGQCVSAMIDENTEEGTKQCRVRTRCPISNDLWTIYYSDETTRKAH